jgi:hypothetical protein
MGTSSARRGPTGRLWRVAKATATRYLAPESAGPAEAWEVVTRYVAALGEGGGLGTAGALAAFRLTRKAAQNLGAFWSQGDSQGWPAALHAWGLQDWAEEEPVTLAPSLGAALAVPGAGLEQAVARTALVQILLEAPASPGRGTSPAPALFPGAPRQVRRFLSAALHLRLALDLGESLEAAAAGFAPLQEGLSRLGDVIQQAAEAGRPPPEALTPEHWLGLPGWTWVTRVLEGLLLHFRTPSRSKFL